MQYINYFILSLIYLNILFSSLIISRILIGKIAEKYNNIKQYKISNWYFTIFSLYFYISFPLLGLYLLRIYHIDKSLDLRILLSDIKKIIFVDVKISYTILILIIIILITIILNILLSIIIIYKKLNNQLFNFWFYIQYDPLNEDKLANFIAYCRDYGGSDFMSFELVKFSHHLNHRIGYYKNNLKWDKNPNIFSKEYKEERDIFYKYCEKRPWYHFDVIITKILGNRFFDKFILPLSPIIVILYDCIFNSWVITHVYYYLLLYIPLMLFRRFTTLLSTKNNLIGKLFWDILYKKESCIYTLPKDHYKLFEIYIANGIKTVDLGPPAVMDFDVSWFMQQSAKFTYNNEDDLYYNGVDRSLKLLPDKRLVYQHTDYDTQLLVEEEWFTIAVKYHYNDDHGKYAVIVHIN